MKNKLYILKFSIISLLFSIIAVVMHLLPSADLMFIKENDRVSGVGKKNRQTTNRPEPKKA